MVLGGWSGQSARLVLGALGALEGARQGSSVEMIRKPKGKKASSTSASCHLQAAHGPDTKTSTDVGTFAFPFAALRC